MNRQPLGPPLVLVVVLGAMLAISISQSAGLPTENLVRPDGSLDLRSGYRGGVSLREWRMTAGRSGVPRFAPDSGRDATAQAGTLSAPSDTADNHWDDRFSFPGTSGQVDALAADGRGNVYVGGAFTMAGGMPAAHIARWDGTSWSALGSGMDGTVSALAVDGGGNVYAGGTFTTAGGDSASCIAKWDGTSWSALGSGFGNVDGWWGDVYVSTLAVDGDGNVYAGGQFTTAGSVDASGIAKWDGTSWSTVSSGMDDYVCLSASSVVVDGAGNVFAAGNWFPTAGGIPEFHIAKWDGTDWSALGSLTDGEIHGPLAVDRDGNVYAESWTGGVYPAHIIKWDGTNWSALGPGMEGAVSSLAVDGGGNVYAGGLFTTVGGVAAPNIAKWDGTTWSALGLGFGSVGGGDCQALAVDGGGNVYAGGTFSTAGGDSASCIAKWDGTSWSALGPGLGPDDYGSSTCNALAVDGGGTVYAGGFFTRAGGVPASNIARWDGTSWSALGSGMDGSVSALAVDGSGNVYAGGTFTTAGGDSASCVAKWDGTSWSALGSGMGRTGPDTGFPCTVSALAVDGDGIVYAGGYFTTAGGDSAFCIAKWDGTSWSALGSGLGPRDSWSDCSAIAVDGSGNVYAGGYFTTAGGVPAARIAKWDGTSWSALGYGLGPGNVWSDCYALSVDAGGNVYAGGYFSVAGSVIASNIAKWDGRNWSALGSGLDRWVGDLVVDASRNVYAGGDFLMAGNRPSAHFAIWHPYAPVDAPDAVDTRLHFSAAPSPFVESTALTFDLPCAEFVRLEAFDVSGRRVRTLLSASQPIRRGGVAWDGSDERGRELPSGVYFLRLHTPSCIVTRRVVFTR